MKKRLIIVASIIMATQLGSNVPVGAQSDMPMTDEHIQRIKQNCRSAMRTLQQLHVNDGPLRVNRGQAYDSVSTKLMAPLNSRLTANKLDASSMVKITAQYDKTLTDFRESYKKYDNQMTSVLKINCVKQPVTFYDAVTLARERRADVHNHVVRLHELIREYGGQFSDFRTQFNTGNIKGESE